MASPSVHVWRTVTGREIFSLAPPFLDMSSILSALGLECWNRPASFTLLLASPFTDVAGQHVLEEHGQMFCLLKVSEEAETHRKHQAKPQSLTTKLGC